MFVKIHIVDLKMSGQHGAVLGLLVSLTGAGSREPSVLGRNSKDIDLAFVVRAVRKFCRKLSWQSLAYKRLIIQFRMDTLGEVCKLFLVRAIWLESTDAIIPNSVSKFVPQRRLNFLL